MVLLILTIYLCGYNTTQAKLELHLCLDLEIKVDKMILSLALRLKYPSHQAII